MPVLSCLGRLRCRALPGPVGLQTVPQGPWSNPLAMTAESRERSVSAARHWCQAHLPLDVTCPTWVPYCPGPGGRPSPEEPPLRKRAVGILRAPCTVRSLSYPVSPLGAAVSLSWEPSSQLPLALLEAVGGSSSRGLARSPHVPCSQRCPVSPDPGLSLQRLGFCPPVSPLPSAQRACVSAGAD